MFNTKVNGQHCISHWCWKYKNLHYSEWWGVKWKLTTFTVHHLSLHRVLQKFIALNFAWLFNDPSNAIKCTNKCFLLWQEVCHHIFPLYGFKNLNKWIVFWKLSRFPQLNLSIPRRKQFYKMKSTACSNGKFRPSILLFLPWWYVVQMLGKAFHFTAKNNSSRGSPPGEVHALNLANTHTQSKHICRHKCKYAQTHVHL